MNNDADRLDHILDADNLLDIRQDIVDLPDNAGLELGVELRGGGFWHLRFTRLAALTIFDLDSANGMRRAVDQVCTIIEQAEGLGRPLAAFSLDGAAKPDPDKTLLAWSNSDEEGVMHIDKCRFVELGPMQEGPFKGLQVRLPYPESHGEPTEAERANMMHLVVSTETELVDMDKPSGPSGCN